jgi:hypothetical protein
VRKVAGVNFYYYTFISYPGIMPGGEYGISFGPWRWMAKAVTATARALDYHTSKDVIVLSVTKVDVRLGQPAQDDNDYVDVTVQNLGTDKVLYFGLSLASIEP